MKESRMRFILDLAVSSIADLEISILLIAIDQKESETLSCVTPNLLAEVNQVIQLQEHITTHTCDTWVESLPNRT